MKLFLLLIILSTQTWAQSSSGTIKTASPASPSNTTQTEFPAFSWERIKSKTKIRYFSEILGPSVKKWNDNEVASDGTILKEPTRMFHSMNIRYQLVGDLSYFMSPRFITVFGDRNDLRATDDQNVLVMDDWQFGFYYTAVKKATFQYGQRLSHRQPFSIYSKNSGVDSQVEWMHDFTWVPASGWRVIHWNNYRYYVYESRANTERYRINFNTLVNYDINDKWRVQLMYELDMQHRNPNKGPEEREWNYFKVYENHMSFGIGYSPVRDWSFIPFVRAMDLANVRNETTIVGLWVLGKVI